MKKYLASILFAACAISAGAESFEAEGIFYQTISGRESGCEVTWSPDVKYSGNIIIPMTVDYSGKTYTVEGIGEYAFAGCEGISAVSVPASVNYIGRNAFQSCTSLTEIYLPAAVSDIGEQAFYYCRKLETFTGKGVSSIGEGAFSNCVSLKEFNTSTYVTYIGDGGFRNCSSLPSFTLHRGIKLGKGVFTGCTSLTSVTFPSDLYEIPENTFSDCVSLTTVSNVQNVEIIGDYAFQTCKALRTFPFGNNLKSIGRNSFAFCSNFHIVAISGHDLEIGPYAFTGCSSIQSVEMTGVYEVGEEAFSNVAQLNKIVFNNTIHYIRDRAFKNCDALSFIGCYDNQPPFLSNTSFDSEVYDKAVLEVPYGKGLLYRQTPPWSYFLNIKELQSSDVNDLSKVYDDEHITIRGRELSIAGEPGEVTVYNIEGETVFTSRKGEGELIVPLVNGGMYIVRYNDKTVKILSE